MEKSIVRPCLSQDRSKPGLILLPKHRRRNRSPIFGSRSFAANASAPTTISSIWVAIPCWPPWLFLGSASSFGLNCRFVPCLTVPLFAAWPARSPTPQRHRRKLENLRLFASREMRIERAAREAPETLLTSEMSDILVSRRVNTTIKVLLRTATMVYGYWLL